jgi:large exoprotein involved in heme utilization and adhesion
MRSQPSHLLCYTFPMMRWVTLAAVTGVGVWALPVRSLPQNGQVKAGEAVIVQPTSDHLNVVQSSDRAVINWTSFGIAGSEWVDFQQPSANSATLNRVTGKLYLRDCRSADV